MGMEIYESNLKRLNEVFPTQMMLPIEEVAHFLGVPSRGLKTEPTFPTKKVGRLYFVPKTALAKYMSE